MPGDVLRGYAANSLRQRRFIPSSFVGSQIAFRVGVQVSAVAAESKHQQELRIHAGGRDVVRSKERDGLTEGLFQLHTPISSQSMQDGKKEGIQISAKYFFSSRTGYASCGLSRAISELSTAANATHAA